MVDERRRDGSTMTGEHRRGDGERDLVAELIQAAGRRERPPADTYGETLEAATAAWRRKVRGRRRRRRYGLAAAVLALALGAGLVLRNLPPEPLLEVARTDRVIGTAALRTAASAEWATLRDQTVGLPAGSLLRTGAASRLGVLLAGGASLRLAEDTEIVLDSATRIRVLAGKVYLDTEGTSVGDTGGDTGGSAEGDAPGAAGTEGGVNGGKALQVVTAAGTVRNLGTRFEVFYRQGVYRLRIRDGRVSLARESGSLAGGPGEQLTITPGGELERARIAADDPEWQWVESVAPAPEVDEQPVSKLLEWVARETGREIRYETPEVREKTATTVLHGSVRHLAPLDALSVMLAATDFAYTLLEDGSILIRSKRDD